MTNMAMAAMAMVLCIRLSSVCATGCDPDGTRDIRDLITRMKAERNSISRQEMFEASLKDSTKGFSSAQALEVFECFPNDSITISQLIQEMGPLMLGMRCKDVVALIKSTSNSFSRMDILKVVVNKIVDLKDQKAILVTDDVFSNYFDKRDAQKLIDEAKQMSCVFGEVSAKRIIFVLDCSGSMVTHFKTDDGRTVTRLQFVAEQLKSVVTEVLQDDQHFNLIKFQGSSAYPWQQGIVALTDANIASAQSYIAGMNANGGTPMYTALSKAMADPDAYAIYLLTDGEPNGNGSQGQILQLVKNYRASKDSHGSPRVVHAIAFMAGSKPYPASPAAAEFMQEVSKAGGGVYRCFGGASCGSPLSNSHSGTVVVQG